MAVRSKRLWGPTTISGAGGDLYICPDNETALIKSITIINIAGGSLSIQLGKDGTLNTDLLWTSAVGSFATVLLNGLFWVLQPGESIAAKSSGASAIITGFGAELEGVAD